MDVLYVRNLFHPRDFGGNRYPWEVTARLAARGHHVRVVTRERRPTEAPPNVELVPYAASHHTPLHTFVTHALGSRRAVRRAVRQRRPDVVVYSSYETAYGHLRRPTHDRPVVYIYHSRFQSDAVDRLAKKPYPLRLASGPVRAFVAHVEHTVYAGADAIIAVSPFSRAEIEARLGATARKISVIPTGVDTTLFCPGDKRAARRALGLNDDTRVALTVGRVVPVKRYDLAVRTLSALRVADGRNWQLLVVGEGPELSRLSELANDLDVPVRFEGHKAGNELVMRYHAADVQLATSDFENWSLALLEGSATGLPVVGVPHAGIPQLLGSIDRSLISPSNDPREIARTVAALFADAAHLDRIRHRAREVALEHDWDHVVVRVESLLENLAVGRRTIPEGARNQR